MTLKLELLEPKNWPKGWQKRDQIAFRKQHGLYHSAGFLEYNRLAGIKNPAVHSNMIREFFGGPVSHWNDAGHQMDCLKP